MNRPKRSWVNQVGSGVVGEESVIGVALPQEAQDLVTADSFVARDRTKDGIECSHAQLPMIWNDDSVRGRSICIQNNVATDLVNLLVIEIPHENLNQVTPTEIAGQPHPVVRISSRTRCSRIREGLGRSI